MRARIGVWLSLVVAMISGGVTAAPFEPAYWQQFTGPSQASLGAPEIFRERSLTTSS